MEEYEAILLVKPEVFVYKIPPRTTNRGYRASDWKLETPDWTGRLRVVAKGKSCILKLEDKATGELFAKAPIEEYPGISIESVMDSSRYFVIRLQDDGGRSAFIGIGFADRGDSFDLNVALQDHFKWLQKSNEIEQADKDGSSKPGLDLGFKAGQTITINIGNKSGSSKPRPKPSATSSGGLPGLLPPPPGGVKIPPPNSVRVPLPPSQPAPRSEAVPSEKSISSFNDDLLGLGSLSLDSTHHASAEAPSKPIVDDLWNDFSSATKPVDIQKPPDTTMNLLDF